MKCKCGKEKEVGKVRCKDCQRIYMKEYMARKRGDGDKDKKDPGDVMLVAVSNEPLELVSERQNNTIYDPSPDWNPDKVITSSNRMMVCPVCGKLSLAHIKMCQPKDPIKGFNYGGIQI